MGHTNSQKRTLKSQPLASSQRCNSFYNYPLFFTQLCPPTVIMKSYMQLEDISKSTLTTSKDHIH